MDTAFWAGIVAAAALIAALAAWFAPARTTILIDTANSTARTEMRALWGLGPMFIKRLLPQSEIGAPLPSFNDARRVSGALMTPGLADAVYHAIQRVFALKPKVAHFELRLNLGDPSQNLVVQTAAQAALAVAPAAIRDTVIIGKCEATGAEVSAKFKLNASPAEIGAIYGQLRRRRAVREFLKRLKKKPAPPKRPVREVRTT